MSHCHCSVCRKLHGTGFSTNCMTEADGFRWQSGKDSFSSYESSPGVTRSFCSSCGSSLPGRPWRGNVVMPAGCLDDDPGFRPERHIFVASKAPWETITDDLPRFDGWDSGDKGLEREPLAPQTRAIRGSCLCGAAAFELDAPPAVLVHCHCSRCRKGRSAAHCANAFVPSGELRWLRGAEGIGRHRVPDSDFTSYFCATCGACMPRPAAEGHSTYAVPAGALDDDPGVRPSLHIWCGSKAPWFEITDDLPQFKEGPPRGN
jgi:hypothetical protein